MMAKNIADIVMRNLFENEDSSEDEAAINLPNIGLQIMRELDEDIPAGVQGLQEIVELLERRDRVAVPLYVEQTVPLYSDEEFVSHFRMKRGVVNDLSVRFRNTEIFRSLLGHGGYEPVTPEKHVLVFLWFVGHQTASYRDVGDRFDLSISCLHDVITRMINFLLELAPTVICFPTEAEKQTTKMHYLTTKGLPDVLGSVDGTHIRIDKPAEDKDAYINRKHYFSFQMQGAVNEKKQFIDVFIGYPGSVHDARVFANSSLSRDMHTLCRGGGYMLGDAAYPCMPQLITPYRDNGHLTVAQRQFNMTHSSCRISVEHAFGKLKQRFRQLYHLKLQDMRRMVQLVHACCVLHNLADLDDLNIFEPPDVDDLPDPEAHRILGVVDPAPAADEDGNPDDLPTGQNLRDELCRQLVARRHN